MRSRRCQDLGGAIVCGGTPTAETRAEVEMFRRYLRGELTGRALRLYTGLDGPEPADLGQVARVMEIAKGGGTVAQAREASGLSVGQAVKLLGWERARLVAIEAGEVMAPTERAALCVLYEVSGFVEAPQGGGGDHG